jgi:hypothetical protein
MRRIFSLTPSGPNVRGFVHSKVNMTTKPMDSSATDPTTVSRVWVDHVDGRRAFRTSSNSTGKPTPPAMTATVIGRQIHQSPTNPTRLSLNRAKPALLKAETAWKTPYQVAVNGGMS